MPTTAQAILFHLKYSVLETIISMINFGCLCEQAFVLGNWSVDGDIRKPEVYMCHMSIHPYEREHHLKFYTVYKSQENNASMTNAEVNQMSKHRITVPTLSYDIGRRGILNHSSADINRPTTYTLPPTPPPRHLFKFVVYLLYTMGILICHSDVKLWFRMEYTSTAMSLL